LFFNSSWGEKGGFFSTKHWGRRGKVPCVNARPLNVSKKGGKKKEKKGKNARRGLIKPRRKRKDLVAVLLRGVLKGKKEKKKPLTVEKKGKWGEKKKRRKEGGRPFEIELRRSIFVPGKREKKKLGRSLGNRRGR